MTSPAVTAELRADVRNFLSTAREDGVYTPASDCWLTAFDADFSAELAQRGWVGMTIPEAYGGPGRTASERFVVAEELVAAGAPVAAHWVADRQVGPNLLRFGSEEQKRRFLPSIAAGECFFAIGMSEPDAGSDLAAVRTRAERVADGYRLNGTKVWTSNAHLVHWMIALVRTSPPSSGGTRHEGLSQMLVDLREDDVGVRPIVGLDGREHFCEVVFEDTIVPTDRLLGGEGQGWAQVTSELAFERSGPERYLSTVPLFRSWADGGLEPAAERDFGRLLARLWGLRVLSASVAQALDLGDPSAGVRATIVKSKGAEFERDVIDVVRRRTGRELDAEAAELAGDLARALLASPGFSLRGGTTEILRTLIAREWLSSWT